MNNDRIDIDLAKRPIFLAVLPVEVFTTLPKKYLFNELGRLETLLVAYPNLIATQTEASLATALEYCHSECVIRYAALRKLVNVSKS